MIPSSKENIKISFKKAHTKTKEFAFMKAHELNNIEKHHKKTCPTCDGRTKISGYYIGEYGEIKCPTCNGYGNIYEKVKWRVGKNTNKQLVIDIDGKDKNNLRAIMRRLKNLFHYDFVPVETNRGFHLIGTNVYKPSYIMGVEVSDEWEYANCLILNTNLKKEDYKPFMLKLITIDDELKDYQGTGNFRELYQHALIGTGLLSPIGNIDIMYNVLCLKYGEVTLRISKKHENDNYKVVDI